MSFPLIQYLTSEGTLVEKYILSLSHAELVDMYCLMLLVRNFDERALKLQRQGRIGTYAPCIGQEAAQVGSAAAINTGDWVFSTYREAGVHIALGKPLRNVLLYPMGHIDGAIGPQKVNLAPPQIMLATQIPHAVGTAWAARYKGENTRTIVYFGDGATSKGDFHEALNMAAVLKAPVVFFCQNNQWAISTPVKKQMATETIAEKAVAYGVKGVRVDGNDVIAVYEVTKEAFERVMAGEGPTLIEAFTYRYGPHTTSDDPSRYRAYEELEEWQIQRDPIVRMRTFLEKKKLWDSQKEASAIEEIHVLIKEAVQAAEATPETTLPEIMDFVYAAPTPELMRQKEDVLAWMIERA